jgi:hypothetical protein
MQRVNQSIRFIAQLATWQIFCGIQARNMRNPVTSMRPARGEAACDMDMGDAARRGAGVYPPFPEAMSFVFAFLSSLGVVRPAAVPWVYWGACCCPMLTHPCESPLRLLPPRSAMILKRGHAPPDAECRERAMSDVSQRACIFGKWLIFAQLHNFDHTTLHSNMLTSLKNTLSLGHLYPRQSKQGCIAGNSFAKLKLRSRSSIQFDHSN